MTAAASRTIVGLAVVLAGCGLTLDYDPPDPRPGLDAGAPDGGRSDAGGTDAGGTDAGSDAGPRDCREDVDCDDGDACTGQELCVGGACVPGEPISCPDDDLCDGVDHCVDGECVPGTPPVCVMDLDPCNGQEICDPVVGCTTLPPPPCDDGIACTRDSCEPFEGCQHEADASLCTDGEGGRCVVDLGGCQYDVCDSTTCVSTGCVDAHCESDVCTYTPRCDAGTFCCAGRCEPAGCDDGNPCTADVCDPAIGCAHRPTAEGTPCDDGRFCTVLETCQNDGSCGGGMARPCSDGNACTSDSCDPVIGCTNVASSDTPCSDGDACTTPDTCVDGTCVPGPTRSCALAADRGSCVVGRCEPATGCVFEPIPEGRPCLSGVGTCDGAGHCCGTNTDCDGDRICECPAGTTCGFADGCPGGDCNGDGDCSVGEVCCRSASMTTRGYCVPAGCPSCCVAAVAT